MPPSVLSEPCGANLCLEVENLVDLVLHHLSTTSGTLGKRVQVALFESPMRANPSALCYISIS